jgi:Outer membrane lipoprotein-sorting protein
MKFRPSLLLGVLLGTRFVCAADPIVLSPAEAAKAGHALVAEMLSLKPDQKTTSTGFLKIQNGQGKQTIVPVTFEAITAPRDWKSIYETGQINQDARTRLTVIHAGASGNVYRLSEHGKEKSLTGNETMTAFAGSDFWVADLGLEFLRWPEQRLIRKELRRGQSCNVLESINPEPAAGAYSRVVSWIDIDTHGIINATAYDSKNKALKEFSARKFKKVNGEWHLEQMEIENRQTDSVTQIDFDVGGH